MGEMARYLTERYMPKHNLSARNGAPPLTALRTISARATRSKNSEMSNSPDDTHLPTAATASALGALR